MTEAVEAQLYKWWPSTYARVVAEQCMHHCILRMNKCPAGLNPFPKRKGPCRGETNKCPFHQSPPKKGGTEWGGERKSLGVVSTQLDGSAVIEAGRTPLHFRPGLGSLRTEMGPRSIRP